MTGTAEAEAFTRRLTAFSTGTARITHVVAVSPEGLLIGRWGTGDRSDADRLAAITSGLTSLAGGTARTYRLGVPSKVVIEFAQGHLLVSAIGHGAMLGVVTGAGADVGVVAYEMAMFAAVAGRGLTPAVMAELKNTTE